MTYLGSDAPINWLQCLFWFSIFQWLLTAVFLVKNRKQLLVEIPGYSHTVPFIKDTFYIYWNLYPIVFYLLFHNIESNFSFTLASLDMISQHQATQDYNFFFMQDIFDIPWRYIDISVFVLSIFLAYLGAFHIQPKKQAYYIKTRSKIYWWDKRLNQIIYYIRLVFLFFNLIFIAFMVYLLTKLALFIVLFLSHSDTISISPFHPDHYGGLVPILDIASTFMLIYLFRIVMGIKGFMDHQEAGGMLQKIGDYYHVAHTLIALMFLPYFLFQTNILLNSVDVVHFLNPELFKALISAPSHADPHAISTSAGYLRALQEFNSTPVVVKIFTGTLFATFSSFIIWFFHHELASFFQKKAQT